MSEDKSSDDERGRVRGIACGIDDVRNCIQRVGSFQPSRVVARIPTINTKDLYGDSLDDESLISGLVQLCKLKTSMEFDESGVKLVPLIDGHWMTNVTEHLFFLPARHSTPISYTIYTPYPGICGNAVRGVLNPIEMFSAFVLWVCPFSYVMFGSSSVRQNGIKFGDVAFPFRHDWEELFNSPLDGWEDLRVMARSPQVIGAVS